jgi:hypothetical protein
MPFELSPPLDGVWTDIDGQVRGILADHLRSEFHCVSPDTMRFKSGEIGGWRATGTSRIRPYAVRRTPIALSLTLVWDATAAGGRGAPLLTVDPGVDHTGDQVTKLLERLQLLRADIVVRLLGQA